MIAAVMDAAELRHYLALLGVTIEHAVELPAPGQVMVFEAAGFPWVVAARPDGETFTLAHGPWRQDEDAMRAWVRDGMREDR